MDPMATFTAPGRPRVPAGAPPAPAGAPGGTPRRGPARLRERAVAAAGAVGLRTVPGRIRLWSLAAVLGVITLFAVATAAIGNARSGLEVIGREAGPQVVATSSLYFALSDMDAQVAEVLLIGRERNLGIGRQRALALYERRRGEANRALRQASVLAGRDRSAQATVDAVLDGIASYERLASRAIVLDEQAGHPAGPPPERVMAVYRQATDLMRLELLPKASNLTLDNAVIVRNTYEDRYSSAQSGFLWVMAAGGALLGILLGLQLYLAMSFRRILNPGLALATLASAVLLALAGGLVSTEAEHLRVAKRDGFDSVLGLSRARAMSHDANADQSRYLIDERWADRYEQVYLDKSKQLVGVEASNTGAYLGALDRALARRYGADGTVSFVGLYGRELALLRSADDTGLGSGGDTRTGQSRAAKLAALETVFARYRQFQRDDRRMRDLVKQGTRRDAIVFRVNRGEGGAAYGFDGYDRAVVALTEMHRQTFAARISAGERALRGWNVQLPAAAIIIIMLVLLGVRPRLAEYR
jgi:hypothetical protein